MKMDLNRTTTISSRRKTFTVPPVPACGTLTKNGPPCNQTYLADESGILDITVPEINTSTFETSFPPSKNDGVPETCKDLRDAPSATPKLSNVLVHGFEKHNINILNLVVSHRNSTQPFFTTAAGCYNVSSASNFPMFESSTTEEHLGSYDNSIEFENLRLQEKALKDAISEMNHSASLSKKLAKADAKKYQKKTKELKNRTKQNLKEGRQAQNLKASYKENFKTAELMALDLSDRIDFPKKLIESVLKVRGDDGLCQDQEFCREFGGKCHSAN